LALTAFDIKDQQISVLIEAGADFSIKDKNDQTPLERAEKHNTKEYKEYKRIQRIQRIQRI
jgi:ankyrin repeat protein